MRLAGHLGDVLEPDADLDALLTRAKEREGEYDWLGALDIYAHIGEAARGHSIEGRVAEDAGHALFRAGCQSDSPEAFREKLDAALKSYGQAERAYARDTSPHGAARAARCKAWTALLTFWRSSQVAEKRKAVAEAWELARGAMTAFEELGEGLEYGRTYDELAFSNMIRFLFETDPGAMVEEVEEGISFGDKGIELLSNLGDRERLARLYVETAAFYECYRDYKDLGKWQGHKIASYWKTAAGLSEESTFLSMLHSGPILSSRYLQPSWLEGPDFPAMMDKALAYARGEGDRLAIGYALDLMAMTYHLKLPITEESDARIAFAEKTLECMREAKKHFSAIDFFSPRVGLTSVEGAEAYEQIALAIAENDSERVKGFVEKAMAATEGIVERAVESEYLRNIWYAHWVLNLALTVRGRIEREPKKKEHLLRRALEHGDAGVEAITKLEPFGYGMKGPLFWYRCKTKFALGSMLPEPTEKVRMIEATVEEMEVAIDLTLAYGMVESPYASSRYGTYYTDYGNALDLLFSLRRDRTAVEKAVKAYGDAAALFRAAGRPNMVAECHWKMALDRDLLGDLGQAAEDFSLAAENFKAAAEKTPSLKGLFDELSVYMGAWSCIEKARYHHGREEPEKAAGFYREASEMHESTSRWQYLSANYSAWADVERAEMFSSRDMVDDSVKAFGEAMELFRKAKKAMESRLELIPDDDEREMVGRLVKAADLRQKYCKARMVLESARRLDREGEEIAGADEYAKASQLLQDIVGAMEPDTNRRELEHMAVLARAWEAMARAEASASPESYTRASQLFLEAKDASPAEKKMLLCTGHSRIARAFANGTRFADSGEEASYTAAIQDLESASVYYLRAGHHGASEHVRGCKLLLDGYSYVKRASTERDSEKKARLYALTEKVLDAAASSFEKSGHLGKHKEAAALAERVRVDKELAISFSEVMKAPDFVSTPMSFATPTSIHERAAGADRFAHADLQVAIAVPKKEVLVGDDIELDIEVVNAGRATAQLTRLEDLIPRGFEMVQRPHPFKMEGDHISLRGKRLEPSRSENISILLKPTVKGDFSINARLRYLDEVGASKCCEMQRVDVAVRELGVSGWLRGAKKKA